MELLSEKGVLEEDRVRDCFSVVPFFGRWISFLSV